VLPIVHTARPRPDTSYSSLLFASILADGETRTFNVTGERSTGFRLTLELAYAVSYLLDSRFE
jgi:hypothetical protein